MPGDEFKALLPMERGSAVRWKSLEANFFAVAKFAKFAKFAKYTYYIVTTWGEETK